MTVNTKVCTKCGIRKHIDEFSINNIRGKDGRYSQCKECRRKIDNNRYQIDGREHYEKVGRQKYGYISMYENKSCSLYLGVVVAERLIKHLFNDVEMMPTGFPGYDMICNRGKKINVKASTIHKQYNKNSTVNRWTFKSNYNKDCDYFLCMAFDNVIDLNPLMAWMIPGKEVNHLSTISISSSTIHKWDQWKMDMTDAQSCCNLMKDD